MAKKKSSFKIVKANSSTSGDKNLSNKASGFLNKNKIRRKNPDIFHFSKSSRFIYEPTHSKYYFDKYKNHNIFKHSREEMDYLGGIIKDGKNKKESNKLFVLPFFKDIMDNVLKTQPDLDKRDLLIKSIVHTSIKNENISVKKVPERYNSIAELNGLKKMSLSLVHMIMRKKLLMKFRKKTVKSKKLEELVYIKYIFFFLKIFCRAIRFGLKFIFLDESGFFLHNNHFRNWVENKEEIYFYNIGNKKLNLLLAVSNENIIHYKIQEENTNSYNFNKFMKELIEKIDKNDIQNYVVIMDNCSCHLTNELFETYYNNNLKILFNVPYLSNFNMVENVFRLIKNNTYKKLYNSTYELKSDIIKILDDKKTKSSLNNLFNETLGEYIEFIKKNENVNLNF